jgi:cysteine desulfurase/selenocysteine lyase
MNTPVTARVSEARADFPILRQQVNGHPLVYLDNAATTQKPRPVIDALLDYYTGDNSNIHRGVHTLSERATARYEAARELVRAFLKAASTEEIVFTRGTTESINLVRITWGRASVRAGDEVLITALEHHSNIVPWQLLCQESGAVLKVAPINDAGEVVLDEYARLLSPKTRLVGMAHVSNALGTVNPVAEMIRLAHAAGALALVDGAQAVAHRKADVRALEADFYAFSGHKLYGPTGIGVLYGRKALLNAMPPYHGGGDMIRSVTFEKTTYNDLPYRFEAGTPNIAGVIGLGKAIEYLEEIGLEAAAAHEHELLVEATRRLESIEGVRILGTAREKAAVISFVIDGIHPHDIGTVLDTEGVAVRAGHHCAQPVMDRFGVPATTRASFAFYNTIDDVEALVRAVIKVKEIFG